MNYIISDRGKAMAPLKPGCYTNRPLPPTPLPRPFFPLTTTLLYFIAPYFGSMVRTTRNSSSGGLESLPYPSRKKGAGATQSLTAHRSSSIAVEELPSRASKTNNANANFSIPVKRRITDGEPGPKPKKQQRHSFAGNRSAPAVVVSSQKQTRGARGKQIVIEDDSDGQEKEAGASMATDAESVIHVRSPIGLGRRTRSQAQGKAVENGANAGRASDEEGFMDNIISDLVAQSKLPADVDSLEPDADSDEDSDEVEDARSADLASQNSADLADDDYSSESGHGNQGEHEIREDTQQDEVTPFDEFRTKVSQSIEGLATFKSHLGTLLEIAKELTTLQSASGVQSGYLKILPVLVAALKPVTPELTQQELVVLGEFDVKLKQMKAMGDETRALQSDLRSLLKVLATETKAINHGIASIEGMFKERGYEMDEIDTTTPPSKTRGASKRMEALRAREEAVYKFNTPAGAPPRKSRRSRRIEGRIGVENGYHSDNAEENRYQGSPIPSEDLSDYPPVLGGDADVEVVRVESFGHRPEKTTPRVPKRHQIDGEEDSPVPVHEDRPWTAEELKGVFSKIARVKRGGEGAPLALPSLVYTLTRNK